MTLSYRGWTRALITAIICLAPLACSEGSNDDGTGPGEEGGAGGSPADDGGATGDAGATAASCAKPTLKGSGHVFDESIESWEVGWAQTYDPATDSYPVDNELKAAVSVDYDSDNGNPCPGSLMVEIPFTAAQQGVELDVMKSPAIDLSGKIVTAMVQLNSGMVSSGLASRPGGAQIVLKSGSDYVYASSGWTNVTNNEWVPLTLDCNAVASGVPGFDCASVVQVGISIGNNEVLPDGSSWKTAIVHIDSVIW
jgi:hypothetical protein